MRLITLSGKGQLAIPKAMREQLGLKPGARLAVTLRDGELRIKPVAAALDVTRNVAKAGLLFKPGRKKLPTVEEQRRIAALTAARA